MTAPSGVRKIGPKAFSIHSLNGSLTLPEGLEVIDGYAFADSSFTGTLQIPTTVKRIEHNAFQNCSGFDSLVLPDTVTSIRYRAFYNCYNLRGTLVLPEKLEFLGYDVFYGCRFQGTVEIPAALKNIEDNPFRFCGLSALTVAPGNPYFRAVDGVLYSADLRNMISCPSGKTSPLVIPAETEAILKKACADCKHLTGPIVFPENLTGIPARMFKNCSGLTGASGQLFFPDKIIEIDQHAFYDCTKLTGEAYIPFWVTIIYDYSFTGCGVSSFVCGSDDANHVTIDGILYNSFSALDLTSCPGGRTKPVVLPDNLYNIKNQAFRNCRSIGTKLVIPASTAIIGKEAFANSSLTELVFTSRNAPEFDEHTMDGFNGTAYYPSTWSELELPANSEHVTWVCRCDGEHTPGTAVRENEIPATYANDGSYDEVVYCIDCGQELSRITITIPKKTLPFLDVPEKIYYYKPVCWAVDSNITKGIDATHFGPGEDCTRAQIAAFLWNAAGRP